MSLEIIPVPVSREVEPDDKIENLIKTDLQDCDVIIVSQKIISKQEGRIIQLDSVIPSLLSVGIASEYEKDPKLVEVILAESKRIVRMKDGILIVETHHGFVCANAGIDESNVPKGLVTLLPKNPDESASRLRRKLLEKTGKQVAVIISDTFGRPHRMGQTDCAIGISGIEPIIDYEGVEDKFGKKLRVTAIAIADEMCSAAELVRKKTRNTPIAIIRNYKFSSNSGTVKDLIRPKNQDMFR